MAKPLGALPLGSTQQPIIFVSHRGVQVER
jgi:hypothetical protein